MGHIYETYTYEKASLPFRKTEPFYKHGLLRIIPYEGGPINVLGYLSEGQGSINVLSCSPNSKKISFVPHTDK